MEPRATRTRRVRGRGGPGQAIPPASEAGGERALAHRELVVARKEQVHVGAAHPFGWEVSLVARSHVPFLVVVDVLPGAPGIWGTIDRKAAEEAGIRLAYARQLLPPVIATTTGIVTH